MSTPNAPAPLRRFQLGDAICNLDDNTLTHDGVSLRLEPRLAGLLSVLAQQAGQTISRSDLLALVWDEDGSDEALTQAVSRLRRGLGDKALIETVPRIGYRLSQTPRPIEPAPVTPPGLALWRDLPNRLAPFRGVLVALAAGMAGAVIVLMAMGRDTALEQEFEIQNAQDSEIEFIPQGETP
ncbi:winged helix-turn-helix domain-containing protein [Oceanicaulis sp.]|uniref:winged helix-turn-helix domain-containing protein n=1 Tax=Oceanicaulis sp. TaxID=1924941 RepID=UPI003D2C3D75